METPDGGLSLPFIASSRFGLGMGAISTSGDPFTVLSGAFGQHSKKISKQKLEASYTAILATPSAYSSPFDNKKKPTFPCVAEFASLVKDLHHEWVLYENGTAVPLNPEFEPIHSIEEFAACFCDYPFHRVKFELYQELASRYIALENLPPEVKEKASKATRQLLEDGYPVPGVNSDRYMFLRGNMGLTWLVDDMEELANYECRRTTDDELAQGGLDKGHVIWTVADPQIEEHLTSQPLTITSLTEPTPRPPPGDYYRCVMSAGVEDRRLDYMLPKVIGALSTEGNLTMF